MHKNRSHPTTAGGTVGSIVAARGSDVFTRVAERDAHDCSGLPSDVVHRRFINGPGSRKLESLIRGGYF